MTDPQDRKLGDELSLAEKRQRLKRLLEPRAAAGKDGFFPLSYGQQALWFIYRSAPESSAYNWIYQERSLHSVDVTALRQAVGLLLDRHEQLRVRFSEQDDGLRQQVLLLAEVPFEFRDASAWSQERLDREISEETSLPFDLFSGPVIRFRVFRRSDHEHVLLVVAHHIVIDGRSIKVLMQDLRGLLTTLEADSRQSLPPPAGDSYREFVGWERQMLASSQGDRLEEYWRQQLAGVSTALDLPTDFPRPEIQRFVGDSHQFGLPDELTARLADLARGERTSVFAVILAALNILLWRYAGQDDLLIGTPMATRSKAGFERTIGYFVNSVVLRSRLSAELTVRELIRQVRGTVIEALEHQDYPFALLVEKLHPHRDSGRSPIFQVMLTWNRAEPTHDQPAAQDLGSPEAGTIAHPQQEGIFDLHLEISETARRLPVMLNYDTALFKPATIARMAGHLQTVLEGMAEDPGQQLGGLSLLTPDERREITVEWNQTGADFPRTLQIGTLIERQAGETPDAIAASCDGEALSYGELNRQANRLARYLVARGAGPGSTVGISLDRSLEMLVALVGILKSGAAYVPLDPGYPAARLTYMLADADVAILVTSEALVSSFSFDGDVVLLDSQRSEIERQSDENPPCRGSSKDLAYIIHTSGSTGRPKGVGVQHRNVTNFLESMRHRPGLDSRDTLLAVTTISFDIHILELFLPLLVGARVEIASRDLAADGPRLLERLRTSKATVMQATPTTWQMLIASGWKERLELKALCGGEALTPSLARHLSQRTAAVWNMYGPTETTVWSSIWEVGVEPDVISVGHPIANTQLHILDDRLQPLPIGVTGELYIGGDGVTPGYIRLPEQTAERFLPDPFSAEKNAKLYRTGDLARYRDNGEVEVLGRVDHQVKLRGFRVELGEIESSLRHQEEIREALVTVRGESSDNPALVAYLVAEHPDEKPSAVEVMDSLKKSLPQYMVPGHYVWLDRFPVAPNGKVDRRALPAPEHTPRAPARTSQVTVSATEAMLIEVWQEVLGLAEIDVYDTFFDLGGHSLLSLQVVDRLEKAMGVRLNPTELINQTVRQLAARCDELARQLSTQQDGRLSGKILGALKGGLFKASSET